MKTKILAMTITVFASLQGQAAITNLVCTNTKSVFGGKPEIIKVLPFEVKPGNLPTAGGDFDLAADTKITVNSIEISNEIQTVFFISAGKTSFQVGFRNRLRDQRSQVLLNNTDIITCTAVN